MVTKHTLSPYYGSQSQGRRGQQQATTHLKNIHLSCCGEL